MNRPSLRTASLYLSAIAVCASLSACTGTDTGNPFVQDIRVGAHTSDPGAFDLLAASGGGVVLQAWLSIGEIEMAGCESETAVAQTDVLGAADRAQGDRLVSIEVEASTYCRVDVPLLVANDIPAGAPPELADASVVVIGTTEAGTDFRIVATLNAARLENSAGFDLDEDGSDLFLGFDIAKWLTGIDIDGGDVDAGVVIIDAANNASLLTAFESNFPSGLGLYRDENGNGDVDPGDEELLTGSGQ